MPSPDHDYKPVKVYSSFNPQDILLAKLALEREDIRFETTNEIFGGLHPFMDGMATVDILVDQRDVDRALKALEFSGKRNQEG